MFLYLIASTDEKTYIGITSNLEKRLRQHNGVIVGGAKKTSLRTWTLKAHIKGFATRTEARKLEWALQHTHRSKRLKPLTLGIRGLGARGSLQRRLNEFRLALQHYSWSVNPLVLIE